MTNHSTHIMHHYGQQMTMQLCDRETAILLQNNYIAVYAHIQTFTPYYHLQKSLAPLSSTTRGRPSEHFKILQVRTKSY